MCQTLSSFSLCFHTLIWSFLFPVISSFIPICVWFAPHLMLFPLIVLWVHKPWVFPESLSVNSSMWLCILCSVIKFPLFLLPLVSRVLPAARPWQIDGPKGGRWRSAAAAHSWSWSAVRGVSSTPPAARPAHHLPAARNACPSPPLT